MRPSTVRVVPKMFDAFISHASANRATAAAIEAALSDDQLTAWLDDTDLQIGTLLRDELQASIGRSRVLVLLWSAQAAQSRWVQAEWLTAFHLDRFIVPCMIDDTPLPQCLGGNVFLRLPPVLAPGSLDRIPRAVRAAPSARNRIGAAMRGASDELTRVVDTLARGQHVMTTELEAGRLDAAAEVQARLDRETAKAVHRWPLDPMVVKLDGYHRKNAFLLAHWDAIQAGRGPTEDAGLRSAEWRFFETVGLDPTDPESLNGLGSVLLLERELDAAEFFVRAALAEAKARGWPGYPAAEHDLGEILRQKALSARVFIPR